MLDPVRRTSAADIAGAIVLTVASITAPDTELNARAGVTNGAPVLVTQNVAGINEWTLYAFDATSNGAVNSPYVVAASGSGQWIAVAGKYGNGALALAKTLNVTGTTTLAGLNATSIGATTPGTGAFTTLSASNTFTSSLATDTTGQGNGAALFSGGVSIAKSTGWSAASRWGLGASIIERSFFECAPVHADNTGLSVFGWDFNPSLSNANSYEGASVAGSVQSGKDVATWYGFRAYNTSGSGTISATQYGFHCAALSKGATNYAFFSAGAGLVKFGDTTDATAIGTAAVVLLGGLGIAKRLCLDGGTGKTIRITNSVANNSVAVTLGSTGPTGSTAGAPQGWMRIDIAGTDRYIPFW